MILAVVVFVAFLCIWVLPPYLKQGKVNRPSFKWNLLAMALSAVAVFFAAAGLQLLLLKVQAAVNAPTVVDRALDAFISASLIEEFFKGLVGALVLKWSKAIRRIDAIFIFAASGIGFEVTESLMSMGEGSDLIAGILRGALCLHVFLQLFMGAYYYKFKKTGKTWDFCLAFLVPFVVHGLNDFFLFLMQDSLGAITEMDPQVLTEGTATAGTDAIIGLVYMLLVLALNIVFMVITLRMVYREAKLSRAVQATEDKQEA